MKFAKFLMTLIVVAVIGAAYYFFVMRPKGMEATGVSTDEFIARGQAGRRGDNPNYAEELKQNAALTQETQRKQNVLEQTVNSATSSIQALNDQQQNLLSLVEEMSKQLQESSGKGASNPALAEEFKKMLEEQKKNLTEEVSKLKTETAKATREYEKKIQALETELKSKKDEASLNLPETTSDTGSASVVQDAYYTPTTNGVIVPYGSSRRAESDVARALGATQAANGTADGNYLDKVSQAIDEVTSSFTSGVTQGTARGANASHTQPSQSTGRINPAKQWPTVFPVYTLPPNTVLGGSTLITPMIGRVPTGLRDVTDPFFFRVEIGEKNLAANGHQIRGVARMIASGFAIGVREQQCVRGYIDSLTFIFVDGTIVTHGKSSGAGASTGEQLGWLADPWGKPCIRGRYINNAGDYLKSRSSAAFLEAAAEALSQGQISYRQDQNGNYQAILDGNVWQFVFGKGVSGTASEIADYVRERTANAFDVVYVDQGQSVQIMLDTQIPIDYDAKARKVNYYAEPETANAYD